MPRSHLRSLAHPHHGVVGHRMPRTLEEDLAALALVLPPGCVATHELAAALWHLPAHWDWRPGERLAIGRVGRFPPTLATVDGHRLAPGTQTVRLPGVPVPVVCEPDVFRQLAPRLGHRDLVALGDMVLRRRSPWALADLHRALEIRSPGRVAARAALADVRPGVASRMESLTRQDFVAEGLPEPELNAPVHDADGVLVAIPDFLWRRARVVVEYDGEHHFRTAQQRLDDQARRNRLERLGYTVVVITRIDYFQHHAETMDRVRQALGM